MYTLDPPSHSTHTGGYHSNRQERKSNELPKNSLEWVKCSCICELRSLNMWGFVLTSSYYYFIHPAWKWNYVSFNVLEWSNLTVTMRKHWRRQVHLSKQWFPRETSHKTVKLVLLWWNQFSLHVLTSIWCVYLVKYITFHCVLLTFLIQFFMAKLIQHIPEERSPSLKSFSSFNIN